jgi:hypothetical protein
MLLRLFFLVLLHMPVLAGCGSPGAEAPDAPGADLEPAQDLSPEADAVRRLPPGRTFTTPWAAGAATKDITPTHAAVLGGFGLCEGNAEICRYAEGVHDPLTVQAAALADPATGEVVIFVGVDSVGLMRHDIDQIHAAAPAAFMERFGVVFDGPRIVIGASHAHSAPDTLGLYGPMDQPVREEEAYIGEIRAAILAAALDAFGALGDAALTWGTGWAPTTSDDQHHVDEEVFVLGATRPGGEGIFVLTRWPVHPTGYDGESNAISADYMGPYRQRMIEALGGAALFLNGPQGSTYAEDTAPCAATDAFPEGWQDPDVTAEEHAHVACVGDALAAAALGALDAGRPLEQPGIVFRHAQFEFHPTNILLAFLLKDSPVPIEVGDINDPATRIHSQLSWVSVGELNFLTTPGESFPSFAAHARDLMTAAGVENVVVLGLTQDWLGYLMSEEQYFEDGLSYYRTLSPGETVEPAFLARLQALLDEEEGR